LEERNMEQALFEQEQIVRGLLEETDALLPRLAEMGLAEAEELYGLLNHAAKFTSNHRKLLRDPTLRVALCDRRDIVLDAIADREAPPPVTKKARSRAGFTRRITTGGTSGATSIC
jgi:hypothetical protein